MNHRYFLGGWIHGVNKLVGSFDVFPILPLLPTVLVTVLPILSASTPRHAPQPWQRPAEHPECPSASLSEWPDSLPVYCPLTPCPFLPLPSKCHHCPGFHHGSLHLHATSVQGSHPLPSTALSKSGSPAPTLPQLASPLLCKASSKREGNAEIKCCRKIDKGNNWDKVTGSGI